MRVLVTGAAGVLGKAVVSLIEQEADVELLLTDMIPADTRHEFVQADLSKWEEAQHLCDGVQQVLHIAAIHPWKSYSHEQYLDCNIKATYNVLQAAANAKVRRVIYTSSIAAMGYRRGPAEPLPFDESKTCQPAESLYGISKHVGEQFCEMFRMKNQLPYLALRPGTFVPRQDHDPKFGLALLSHYVHFSDVAKAHALALKSDLENEAVIITAKVPYTHADTEALVSDARSVVLKYFPEAAALEDKGIELPASIPHCYSIAKAERLLGFHPEHNFGEWLQRMLAK